MLKTSAALAVGFALLALPNLAAQSPAPPPSAYSSVNIDSGYVTNPSAASAVVFSRVVREVDTAWLQLHFGEIVNLPEGSFLRMTARVDGGVQRHDGRTIVEWGGVSAMFNGGELLLELVAAPGSRANRVVITGLTRGLTSAQSPTSICGVDDRVLSTDPRQGRLWLGCSGWMIGADLMLTAGHCTTSGTRILEMNVPLSTAGGSLVRANPNDQYPYTELAGLNAGVGSDWRVCRVLPNSTHGQLPTQRNGGQWYTLGAVPASPAGQNIRITGYGTTSSPVSPTWTQVQKTHVGTLSTVAATSLCYATDTTGGNSGSPIIHENTGNAIGIHTHGGCNSSGGGCNSGTRVDRTDLQAAIRAASGTPGSFTSFGTGCTGTGQTPAICGGANTAGGTSSGTTALNEYAYGASTATPLVVTGFSIWSRTRTGTALTVNAALYLASGSGPAAAPVATTTLTVGGAEGFHAAVFGSPVNVPAGNYYVAVDHTAGQVVLAQLASGTPSPAFWRRPAGSGTWATSGTVTTPSFTVACQGGGGSNAVPAIAGSGIPDTGQGVSIRLSRARASAPASMNLGFSNTVWSGGALPQSLALLGAPGCDMLVEPVVSAVTIADGNGNAVSGFTIPNSPALVGVHGYMQWMVLDTGANALGLAASNGLDLLIGG